MEASLNYHVECYNRCYNWLNPVKGKRTVASNWQVRCDEKQNISLSDGSICFPNTYEYQFNKRYDRGILPTNITGNFFFPERRYIKNGVS